MEAPIQKQTIGCTACIFQLPVQWLDRFTSLKLTPANFQTSTMQMMEQTRVSAEQIFKKKTLQSTNQRICELYRCWPHQPSTEPVII
jgi:hypothetical protein